MRLSIRLSTVLAGAFILGCFTAPPDSADTKPPGIGDADTDTDSDTDTGTAYLVWYGEFDSTRTSVDVTYGIAGATVKGDLACFMYGEHSGSSTAPSGCPDCTWEFGTKPTNDGLSGDYCDSFLTDTLFTYYSSSDMWFASSDVKGWGFADLYVYEYGGTEYDLENGIFMYYSGYGWILRHYDYPANGYDSVDESAKPMTAMSYLTDSSGNPTYYYFYY